MQLLLRTYPHERYDILPIETIAAMLIFKANNALHPKGLKVSCRRTALELFVKILHMSKVNLTQFYVRLLFDE